MGRMGGVARWMGVSRGCSTFLLSCFLFCLLPSGSPIAEEVSPTAAPSSEWSVLFDGSSLAQWRRYGQDTVSSAWQIQGDQLVLTEGGGGDLITRGTYSAFELELEWQVAEGGNSGIFILADESNLPIYVHAPEIQILDDARHPDREQADHRSGSLYDLIAAPPESQRLAGEWNQVRIVHDNGHLQAWQNGVLTADVKMGSPEWKALIANSKFATWKGFGEVREGHIGLQDHGDRVAFRNIRIRRLP